MITSQAKAAVVQGSSTSGKCWKQPAIAYAETLAAWSDGHPFTLNVTVNRRLPVHDQVSEVIGDFTAVSLLAVDADPAAGFTERARRLQTRLARDLDHSEFTGIGVLREVARLHGPARAAMPVVFTSALDSAGADFGQAVGGLGTMVGGIVHTPQVHIDHQVFEYDGELVLNRDSVDELFDERDLDGMFHQYTSLVERLSSEGAAWTDVARGRVQPHESATVEKRTTAPPVVPDVTPAAADNAVVKRVLARIWCEVLGVDAVDDTAEFTRLGGDSLLAMQVIAKAADAGLVVSPREFFAHQTVASLAAIARPAGTGPRLPHDDVSPLLPRQLALLDEWDHPERQNYVLLFDVTDPLDHTALKVALRTLLRHHEALRFSFAAGDFGWTGQVRTPDQLDVPLTWVDLTDAADEAARRTVEDVSLSLQSSIDIGAAPLWRVAAFQGARRQQLLIVVNQLICDNYSCRILCEDLLSAYDQVTATGEAVLAPADSVVAWSELVRSRAEDPEVRAELAHWLQLQDHPRPVPLNEPTSDEPALIALAPEATAALVKASAVPDTLLAAIARAVGRRTGDDTVRVDLDAHGRDLPSDGLDPTRVLGRLATRWPLDVPALPDRSLHEAAAATGEARRRVPAAGNHYELLATFCEPSLRTAPAPVLFNYLGHSDALWAPLGLALSPDHPGLLPSRAPGNRRPEFLAGLVSGRLIVACTAGADGLLHEIGNDITVGTLGHTAPLELPAELDVLRHWLAH